MRCAGVLLSVLRIFQISSQLPLFAGLRTGVSDGDVIAETFAFSNFFYLLKRFQLAEMRAE